MKQNTDDNKRQRKTKIGVLETDDKLYYIIYNVKPFVIKEKAIKFAERLNKQVGDSV